MTTRQKLKENVVTYIILGAIAFVAGGFGTYALNSLGKTVDLESEVQVQAVKIQENCNKITELNGKFGATDVTLLRLEKAITRLETIVERLEKKSR